MHLSDESERRLAFKGQHGSVLRKLHREPDRAVRPHQVPLAALLAGCLVAVPERRAVAANVVAAFLEPESRRMTDPEEELPASDEAAAGAPSLILLFF